MTLGGTDPIAIIAGLEVGQINDDGWLDIVVLVKASGAAGLCPANGCTTDLDCGAEFCFAGFCGGNADAQTVSRLRGEIIIYFNPGSGSLIPDGDTWTETVLVNPLVVDGFGTQWHNQFPGLEFKSLEEAKVQPEWSGFTSLVVADIDGQSGDDILVAINPAECRSLGQQPPLNTVDLWINPPAGLAESPNGWGAPVTLLSDLPQVKDIAVMDIDDDGDLDVIATFPNAISSNIRWAQNPVQPSGSVAGQWQNRPIAQLDTGADVMSIGDVDGDGFDDIVVRSTDGQLVQWFRRPSSLVIDPEFPPNDPVPDRFNFPWPVFTLTEFDDQEPAALAMGDLTGNGVLDAVVSVEGGVFWYDSSIGNSLFDPWFPNTIIQDVPTDTTDATIAPGSGVGVGSVDATTHINALLIVDLDGDGKNDIIGTLDRRTGSGLSDDRLVWYRNTRDDVAP